MQEEDVPIQSDQFILEFIGNGGCARGTIEIDTTYMLFA
jgi:hypothetical protein